MTSNHGPVPISKPLPGGHFSHAYRAGSFVFVCGQVGRDRGAPATYAEETTQSIEGVAAILAELGSTLNDVVSVTVFAVDLVANREEIDRAYADQFGDHRPSRAMVGISELAGGARIEIVATAWVDAK